MMPNIVDGFSIFCCVTSANDRATLFSYVLEISMKYKLHFY